MNPHTFSPWLLIAALTCFLMPFFNVSCAGQNGSRVEMARLTGVQLITGTTSDKVTVPMSVSGTTETRGAKAPEKVPGTLLALVDGGLIAAAALAFRVYGPRRPLPGMSAAGLALLSHLWLLVHMQNGWLEAQMKSPDAAKPAGGGAGGATAGSLGDAMIGLSMPQVQVSAAVGWYAVGVLLVLAMVVQFLPRVSRTQQSE